MNQSKAVLMAGLCVLALGARADDLGNAMQAWDAQRYAEAVAGFAKLAKAGNAQAQQMLGEMYAFGEGVAEDPAQARHWLRQAQAGGATQAAALLDVVEQRQQHKADIARLTTQPVTPAVQYTCARPAVPVVSRYKEDVDKTKATFAAWANCVERYKTALLNATNQPVPVVLAGLMNVHELQAARSQADAAYAPLAKQAETEATTVLASFNAWSGAMRDQAYADYVAMQADLDRASHLMEGAALARSQTNGSTTPIAKR